PQTRARRRSAENHDGTDNPYSSSSDVGQRHAAKSRQKPEGEARDRGQAQSPTRAVVARECAALRAPQYPAIDHEEGDKSHLAPEELRVEERFEVRREQQEA